MLKIESGRLSSGTVNLEGVNVVNSEDGLNLEPTGDGESSSSRSFFGDTQPVFSRTKTVLLNKEQAETICEDPFARAADTLANIPDPHPSGEKLDKNISVVGTDKLASISSGSSRRVVGAADEQPVTSREDPFARSVAPASANDSGPSTIPLGDKASVTRPDAVAPLSSGCSRKVIGSPGEQPVTAREDPFARSVSAAASVNGSRPSGVPLDEKAAMAKADNVSPVSSECSRKVVGLADEQPVTAREDPFARSVDTQAMVPDARSSVPWLNGSVSATQSNVVPPTSSECSKKVVGSADEKPVTAREDPFARSVETQASGPELHTSVPWLDEKVSAAQTNVVPSSPSECSRKVVGVDNEQPVTAREDPFAKSVDTRATAPDIPPSVSWLDEKVSVAQSDAVPPSPPESSWEMLNEDKKQAMNVGKDPSVRANAPGSMPGSYSAPPELEKQPSAADRDNVSSPPEPTLRLANTDKFDPTPPVPTIPPAAIPARGTSVQMPGQPVQNLAPAPAAVEALLRNDPGSPIQNQPVAFDTPPPVLEETKSVKGPLIIAIVVLLAMVVGAVVAWPLVARKMEERRLANLVWPYIQVDGVLKASADSPAKAILSGELVLEGGWSPDGIKVIQVEPKKVLLGFEGAEKWVLVGDRTD